MKYTEHRSMSERETRDDRRIFSKDEDVVSRRDAVNDVMEHTSSSANYHKVVLSPGQDEPITDWKEWTRDVMKDLEERQGHELHWYATKHNNTDNPHVHVVIAGAAENRETGQPEPVKLYSPDFRAMEASGREHSEHEWYRQIHDLYKEYDSQERDLTPEQAPERDHSKEEVTRSTAAFDRADFDR
jgi:hypothetical protein